MRRDAGMQACARSGPPTTIPAALQSPWRRMAIVSAAATLLVPTLVLAAAPPPPPPDACASSDTMRAVRALSKIATHVLEGRPQTDRPSCCPRYASARAARDAMTPAL